MKADLTVVQMVAQKAGQTVEQRADLKVAQMAVLMADLTVDQ